MELPEMAEAKDVSFARSPRNAVTQFKLPATLVTHLTEYVTKQLQNEKHWNIFILSPVTNNCFFLLFLFTFVNTFLSKAQQMNCPQICAGKNKNNKKIGSPCCVLVLISIDWADVYFFTRYPLTVENLSPSLFSRILGWLERGRCYCPLNTITN